MVFKIIIHNCYFLNLKKNPYSNKHRVEPMNLDYQYIGYFIYFILKIVCLHNPQKNPNNSKQHI